MCVLTFSWALSIHPSSYHNQERLHTAFREYVMPEARFPRTARFCILIQGVDNPEQAPLRSALRPQNQAQYSPN